MSAGKAFNVPELLTFPFWLKLAYTLGLAFLVLVIVREGLRVWLDRTVYVGAFTKQVDGGQVQSSPIPARALQQHSLLRILFERERARRAQPAAGEGTQGEVGLVPSTLSPIDEHRSALEDLQLKVQGFDLGELLKKLGNYVRPPHEITGNYSQIGATGALIVRWPKPLRQASLLRTPELALTGLASEEAAAAALAAYIVYAQAAPETELEQHPPGEFADWLGIWLSAREVLDRAAPPGAASFETGQPLAGALKDLDDRIGQGADYPELFRLRAEILEVRAKISGKPEYLTAATADRVRYGELLKPVATPTLTPTKAGPESVQARTDTGRIWLSPGSYVTPTVVMKATEEKKYLVLPSYVGRVGTKLYSSDEDAKADRNALRVSEWLPVYGQEEGVALVAAVGNGWPDSLPLADRPLVEGQKLTLRRFDASTVSANVAELNKGPGGSDGPFIAMATRMTKPGDGGAPVLDEGGKLVAMAYAGEPERSLLLPLAKVLEAHGFGAPAKGG